MHVLAIRMQNAMIQVNVQLAGIASHSPAAHQKIGGSEAFNYHLQLFNIAMEKHQF